MNKQEMISKLLAWSDAYYNKSNPLVSDVEYDKLYDEFKSLYPNDPFLKTIGSPVDPASEWKKAKHKIPMGSLNKVVNIDEFNDWATKCGVNQFCVSEKLDGISIDLEYESGKLIKAITRGDGVIGEDITKNVIKMKNVKDDLNDFTGSLRGEIILKKEDFDTIVAVQKIRGENPLKNMRNGASGIAKRYDGKYSEYLSIVYYDVTKATFTKKEKFDYIEKSLGLPTAFVKLVYTNLVMEIYNDYEEAKRGLLDYEIDGLVLECDDLDKYYRLGMKDNRPKGSVAFKFTSIKKETKIRNITWQLGKSGHLTPVAELEPVEIGGVMVKRASLHNLENFKKLNLHYFDTVLVSRRNDVIPFLEKVVKTNFGGYLYEIPLHCPICKTKPEEDGKFLICPNPYCDGSKIGDLKKWATVSEMQSLGIGGKTLEKLYDEGLIFEPQDLYKLKQHELENLEGFGKRSAEKFIEVVQSKKELTLSQFIGGLNIKNFSTSMVDLLVENGYDTLDKIVALDLKILVKVKGIEEKTATSFLNGIEKKKNVIKSLLDVGVKIKEKKVMETTNNKLNGSSFCFTGAVQAVDENGERYKRDKLQSLVLSNGGAVKSSVQNGLDYLVQADPDSASSKSQKARKLGTNIISDVEFLKMIGK